MGTYVDRGRNLRGRLMAGHAAWVALGRTRFASGDNPWPDEGNPPAEDATTDETTIDSEMTGGDLTYGVPYKKATATLLVKPDEPSGSIAFDGQHWSPSTEPDAKHLYFKFIVEPEDFAGGSTEPVVKTAFSQVTGYRRIEVHLGVEPPDQFPGEVALRRKQLTTLPGASLGRLLYYSNEQLIERNVGERHVIELILLC